MGRRNQTLARLGTGCTALASLVWLLWPSDLSFVNNPEAWFVFGTAFIIWVLTELKQSEEVSSSSVSMNDVRIGREMLKLHKGEFRYLLKDQDLWSFVESDAYSGLREFCNRRDDGSMLFHNRKLDKMLTDLTERLDTLSEKIAQDTVPEMIGGVMMTGYIPFRIVTDEEYQLRMKSSKEANAIANQAWNALDKLAREIRSGIPQALDEPL